MTDQRIPAPNLGPTPHHPRARAPRRRPALGRVHRLGPVRRPPPISLVGAFPVIEGILALFAPTTYVGANGVVVALTFTAWGWLHIIIGALVLLVGLALLRDDVPGWPRGTAIVLIALNALVQLSWLPAYPIWSIIMIVLPTTLLAVGGGERTTRRPSPSIPAP